jgi:O-antigen ligase
MSLTGLAVPHRDDRQLLALTAVTVASVLVAGLIVVLGWLALVAAAAACVIALVVWRPRYGLYLSLVLLAMFEPLPREWFSKLGWFIQSDVSTTTPISFFVVTPIELLLALTAVSTLAKLAIARRAPATLQLLAPLLVFTVLLVAGIVWGMRSAGSLSVALWETRALFAAILIALLAAQLLRRREHVNCLANLLCLALIILSIDIVVRRFTVLAAVPAGALDLDFDHATPVLMNLAVILLLARLIWPASLLQRLMALAVPLILYAEMLTERRAGWVGLDIGLVLLAIFVFRLRPKIFYFLVLPMMVVYSGYLVSFWNADGAVAQPARAVRSISSPDPRDAASNTYRVVEQQDIRINIQRSPIAGLGFGQPYIFYLPLPDLSWWPFWHYEAHNSVLWLWMELGPFGLIAFLTLVGGSITRGVQLLKRATRDRSAPVLVAFVSLILMMTVYSFVDLGLFSLRLTAWTGVAIGVIGTWGQLAKAAEEAE